LETEGMRCVEDQSVGDFGRTEWSRMCMAFMWLGLVT